MSQAAGAGVLRAVLGRGRRGSAARLPVAGAQDGPLRARALAAGALRAPRPAHRRAPHAAHRRRARQRSEYTAPSTAPHTAHTPLPAPRTHHTARIHGT